MLDVSSSVPANSIVFSHERVRSFAVIVRGNERAGPSWLSQRPQNALIPLEVKVVADSCRRHKDWWQTSRRLCTAFPVDSCGLTTCHNSPESTTPCCGGLWVNCGTLWRSYHNSPQNGTLVVVACGDHNSLPTTRHNPPTTLLTTCHILPQLTHTLPHSTHNLNIILLQFDQFHSNNIVITSANCVQFLYTVLVYVGGVDHSEKAGSWC